MFIPYLLKPNPLTFSAHPRHIPWRIHFQPRSSIRLVPIGDCDFPHFLVEFTQRGGMDKDEALYRPKDKCRLYRYSRLGSAVLGLGDLRGLHIFQQHQRYLPEDEGI